jgi:hypothetical protein
MALTLVLPHSLLKLNPGKQLEHLRKNAAYSIQGGFLLGFGLLREKPIHAIRGSALSFFELLIWTSLQ